MQSVRVRTGVWYNDHETELKFPKQWEVITHWTNTPPAQSSEEILDKINNPVGQESLRQLAKGKSRPIIIVDDLARPTPVFRIMPFILKEFRIAGVALENIRILVATGTHGAQNKQALKNKIGTEAIDLCQLVVHNDEKNTRYIGKTSFKTPVYTNTQLLNSDLIIGIGGIYPQHTTGFGGGSKLALGVLGRKSITHLHFKHGSVAGRYDIENDFRKDLTEIARLIGLNTIFTIFSNEFLEVVDLICGDHFQYYPEAARLTKERYTAPLPDDADVVIANTYPSDISYTFMRKGLKPLRCAKSNALKIAIASNYEGIGVHGLFAQGENRYIENFKALFRKISIMEPKEIAYKIVKNLFLRNKYSQNKEVEDTTNRQGGIEEQWIYRPPGANASIQELPGINFISDWNEIIDVIENRYPGKEAIKIQIYPCSPLQCLDAEVINVTGMGD